MSTFDKRAQTWDENPMHMERSKAIAKKMSEDIKLSSVKTALEYGAASREERRGDPDDVLQFT